MSNSRYRARIYRFDGQPLRIDTLFGERDTPGNVGVCLSGGSSRAMCAAMGQLRGLSHLTANGKSLLSQVKALSTVSGGSWCGVPFTYLHGHVSDEQFLGAYVPDPGRLTALPIPGRAAHEVLGRLPDRCIGRAVADSTFSSAGLAIQMLLLKVRGKVPAREVWRAIVGRQMLQPYGLFEARDLRSVLFSHNAAVLQRDVLSRNPSLAGERTQLYDDSAGASNAARCDRPYLICNTAMFLRQEQASYRPLAPVQVTPLFAGIVGEPPGTDANGSPVGGMAVSPFAFDSTLVSLQDGEAVIEQSRPFGLADAIASSSAFFAEMMQNKFIAMRDDPDEREKLRQQGLATIQDQLLSKLPPVVAGIGPGADIITSQDMEQIQDALGELCDLIPELRYWSARQTQSMAAIEPTRFADGGSVENTGLGGLLAYDDIDRAIAFVNSRIPLKECDHGVLSAEGVELPSTAIMVDAQLPPLFGYQPYREGIGYRLYAGDDEPVHPEFGRSQLFEPGAFAELLRALWQSSGNAEEPGSHRRPAIAELRLRVLSNRWFGIRGRGGPDDVERRPIELVLVYTTAVRSWYEQLAKPVQLMLGDFDDPDSFHSFPHYSTLKTQLPTEAVSLLAHLTSWVVAAPDNADCFRRLFRPEP